MGSNQIKMKTNLSIVIPLYNESESIKPLFKQLNKLKKDLPKNTEVILVDDGSTDKTIKNVKKTNLEFNKKIVSFSKNFGHQSALMAGLRESKGEMVVTMDGDLQHPPQLIIKMIDLYKQGYQVVLTKKIDRDITSGFKKFSSNLFYKIINLFSTTPIIDSASDFRLLGRNALDALLSLPENRKFLRGLVNWIGFEKIILPFEVQKRAAGESKYSLQKMLVLAMSGITSFSTLPLYFAGATGLLMIFLSIVYSIYIVYQYTQGQTVSGWTSLLLVTLVISSFIFIFLGVIGVYLAAVYDEVKKRPEYILKKASK
jgi:polyisoprenyl-phosphate glycosyltransferase